MSLVLLVRRPLHHQSAIRPRHGAAHENQVVFAVDLDDVEIADSALSIAVLPCRLVALLGTAAAAVAGHGADRAAGAVHLLGAVGGGQALEVMTLHDAGEAAALGGADDIDAWNVLEDVGGAQDRANGGLGRAVEAELANEALRLGVGLGQKFLARLAARLAALG